MKKHVFRTEKLGDLFQNEAPLVWLFYGDSITQGARHTQGYRDYSQIFGEIVRFEMGRKKDVVLNTAISGNNTRNLLEGYEDRVARFSPDILFLMVGMNDSKENAVGAAEFEANLHALCMKFRKRNIRAILQTSSPVVPGARPDIEPRFPQYMDIVRRVAAERELPLIDQDRFWQDREGGFVAWSKDGYHPNANGHIALARHLFAAFRYPLESASLQFIPQGVECVTASA
jgi:lysophospholipase L1-like esterase